MKIESSSFRVRDDYGLFIEVKPIIEMSSEEASKEVFSFFCKYRIIAVYKDINMIDKHKNILATSQKSSSPQMELDNLDKMDKLVRPADHLPTKQLIYIVKNLLPSPFGMNDFLVYMNSKEEYSGYTAEDKREMWKSVYANLKRSKKVELTNPKDGKNNYKYRYIGIDKPEDEVKLKIASLMNGEKVSLDRGE